MLQVAILSTLCIVSSNDVDLYTESHCDTLELNHFYCGKTGKHIFTQWIGWGPIGLDGISHVMWFRLYNGPKRTIANSASRTPGVVFSDSGRLVLIKAKVFRETWTTYDMELLHRTLLPKAMRRRLIPPKVGP